ncbi:MAG: O-antigen ligase family protein [Kiritimatiellae bacterium]|nr:O-antigen ligase family protein [Kiritimatiellia bacterium]
MRFALPRIAVLLHLSLLVVYLAWARGGAARLGLYLPLLWLVPGLLEMTLLFPPLRKHETEAEARSRVRRQLVKDPLFHIGLALLLFMALQLLNGPRVSVFDTTRGQWMLAAAPVPWLPFCMQRGEAAQGLFWFGTSWAAMLAVRHGLTRKARINLIEIVVLSAGLLALFGLVQYASGTNRMFWTLPMTTPFFATFSYAGHAGAFFAISFLASGGLLIAACADEASRARVWRLSVATLLNLLGATFALAYGPLLIVWIGVALGTVYALFHLLPLQEGSVRLRTFAAILLTGGILAFLHFVAYPDNAVHARTRQLLTGDYRAGGWVQERETLRRVALRVWRHHPLYGVGTWGFRQQAGMYLDGDEWTRLRTDDPLTCHSDPLQFLCELGVLGVGLLLAGLAVLAAPVAARLKYAVLSAGGTGRTWQQRFPPAAVGTLCALLTAFVLGAYDLPFRNPLILLVWCMLLAALPSLLPKPQAVVVAAAGEYASPEAGTRAGTSHRHAHGSSRQRHERQMATARRATDPQT